METGTVILKELFPKDRPDTGWMDKAACRDEPPELFYPEDIYEYTEASGETVAERHGLPTVRQVMVEAALYVCLGCPVRSECLYDADKLEGNDRDGIHGIRGGFTKRDRVLFLEQARAERRRIKDEKGEAA